MSTQPIDVDPPQQPTHAASATPKVKLAAEPDQYDGSSAKFQSWIRQVKLYILANGITDDAAKIFLTLSYMRLGTAATYAGTCIDKILEEREANLPIMTFKKFVENLEEVFLDKTLTLKARERLEEFKQGSLTVDEFVVRLGILFHEANLTEDAEQIRIIEKATSRALIDAIYTSGMVPEKSADYTERILKLGRLWETRQLQTRLRSHPTPSSSRAPVKIAPTSHAPPPGDKHVPTGIVHGGRGAPMDIDTLKRDNRCFNCGETGHLRRNCDKPIKANVNVRSLAFNLTDDERQALTQSLALAASVSLDPPPLVSQDNEKDFFQDFLDGR
jgi:hypothetical protein